MSTESFEQQLLLMGEVTRRFKDQGWDLIMVGGSALEFYSRDYKIGPELKGLVEETAAQVELPINLRKESGA